MHLQWVYFNYLNSLKLNGCDIIEVFSKIIHDQTKAFFTYLFELTQAYINFIYLMSTLYDSGIISGFTQRANQVTSWLWARSLSCFVMKEPRLKHILDLASTGRFTEPQRRRGASSELGLLEPPKISLRIQLIKIGLRELNKYLKYKPKSTFIPVLCKFRNYMELYGLYIYIITIYIDE